MAVASTSANTASWNLAEPTRSSSNGSSPTTPFVNYRTILSTRLSYARLKVDHEWTHNTFDEVEHLYFQKFRVKRARQEDSAQAMRSLEARHWEQDDEREPWLVDPKGKGVRSTSEPAIPQEWNHYGESGRRRRELKDATMTRPRSNTTSVYDASSSSSYPYPFAPSHADPSSDTSAISEEEEAALSSHGDFWSRMKRPETRPTPLPLPVLSTTAANLLLLQKPLRPHPSYLGSSQELGPIPSLSTSMKTPLYPKLPRTGNQALGATISFSSLPPPPPLSFGLMDVVTREVETIDAMYAVGDPGVMLEQRRVRYEFEPASQEAPLSMESFDDAFGV